MVALNYEVKHIRKSPYSRSGDKLLRVQAIVVHYTANPGGDADMHYRYFDGLKGRYAGAHIFVDRHKALEIIPLDEVAYHANERKAGPLLSALKATASYYPGGNANLLTIGIEMCLEPDGSIHPDTVERTRLVIKRLQKQFPQLVDTQNRIVRHYDITGKNCPKPFVESPAAWKAFLKSIDEPIKAEKKEEVTVANNNLESSSFPEAQKWVMENGISDGSKPKVPVTREQLWEMLRRMNAGK